MTPALHSITELLDHWQAGDRAAFDKLVPLLYRELRVLAANQLRRERPGHTLPPTALVHEVYLQLAGQSGVPLEGRSHFFGVAARLMRQLLVQHARGRSALKRGGANVRLSLDSIEPIAENVSREVLGLDEALSALAEEDPDKAKIVEMRYFGGFTSDEIAGDMGVSVSTINREMRMALAWIRYRLSGGITRVA